MIGFLSAGALESSRMRTRGRMDRGLLVGCPLVVDVDYLQEQA